MTTLTLVRVAAFSLALALPVAALAQGCHDEAKMSCAEGTAWDVDKQICAPKPSS